MRKVSCIILSLLFSLIFCFNIVFADPAISENIYFSFDASEFPKSEIGYLVNTVTVEGNPNRYISLNDIAVLMANTEKCFRFYKEDDVWNIIPGEKEKRDLNKYQELEESYDIYLSLLPLKVNQEERRYYGIEYNNDLYLSIFDIQSILNAYIPYKNSFYTIFPHKSYHTDIKELDEEGYFDNCSSVLLGDITEQQIFFSKHADEPYPGASTTKLMTFYIMAGKLINGDISLEDVVPIGLDAYQMSQDTYGQFQFYEGQEVHLYDLVNIMLVSSSNEAATAIGEYCSGSEEEFVMLMNETAQQLGMEHSVFYNACGLPLFIDDVEVENTVTANDMFKLITKIIEEYPWIFDIVTQKSYYFEDYNMTVESTNKLLYNEENIIGLKTGTTWLAGYCLTAIKQTEDGHYILAIVYGAPTEPLRFQIPEVLLNSNDLW